jgi:predicted site-specific integrase-resolvase
MAKETITEIEVCVRLGISIRCALNYRKSGKLPPHFKDGRTICYRLADVEAFEKNRSVGVK